MTRKQRHKKSEAASMLPPPRNPFANAAKMLRGVDIHEKSRGALRRERHMKLAQAVKGDLSEFED